MIFIKVNFGGFVPLSTVDWRGRSVCTVFFRGCPLQCSYCQNDVIQTGEDFREMDDIVDMIQRSQPFISGVVFSGGEPTMQKEVLITLAEHVKQMSLAVAIQTNGFFPETLEALINKKLVDKIAIDYKTRWEGFSKRWEGFCNIPKENYQINVRKSIDLCKEAHREKIISEFEVIVTVFPGNEKDVMEISQEVGKVDFVLQQGEHKIGIVENTSSKMTNGEYRYKKSLLQENHPPLSFADLKSLADELGRPIRIRTRELGEVFYESDRRRRASRKR